MRGEARPRSSQPARNRDLDTLARAIENAVIPHLAQRHRTSEHPAAQSPALQSNDVETYLSHLLAGRQAEMDHIVARLRAGGSSVESLYLDLLRPVARRLGEMWCEDEADFAEVTVATGRLQRALREMSPAFVAECEPAPHAYRVLFVQAEGEQHSFGLSMLAEFFRRAGWDVLGSVGTSTVPAPERVRREWVDLVGLSIGSEPRLDWMRRIIEDVRAASLNREVAVMVGGPLFDEHPELLKRVVADGTARDAREALLLAEALVAARQGKRVDP